MTQTSTTAARSFGNQCRLNTLGIKDKPSFKICSCPSPSLKKQGKSCQLAADHFQMK